MISQAPAEVAVQVWTDSEDCSDLTIKDLAEAGYKLIFSNIDGAYLDCGYAGWVTDGNNWCSPYRGWQVRQCLNSHCRVKFTWIWILKLRASY